jgi:glycosyltransferase involved in cell wall biosynthesis
MAIEEIKKEYGDKISIELFGGNDKIFNCEIKVNKPVPFSEYSKTLQKLNWDISIAPLLDNVFNQSKSNIKWLESSMAGCAFVGSNVYPYKHSVKNGETGFVCRNKNQWKNALRKLIDSKELRKELVANAQKEIKENYNISKEVKKYNKFFECL